MLKKTETTLTWDSFLGNDRAARYLRSLAANPDRLATAYLLTGPAGVGKRALVNLAAADLLGCSVSDLERQPDWRALPADTGNLKVETVRGWQTGLRQTGQGRVVGFLGEAERLTDSGASALLKLLEEPPSGVVIFLTTANLSKVLPTIVSRCAVIRLNKVRLTGDSAMVKLADGRPGRLQEWQQTPASWSEFQKIDQSSRELLINPFWQVSLLANQVLEKGDRQTAMVYLDHGREEVSRRLRRHLADRTELQRWLKTADRLIQAYAALRHNVTNRLVFESLAL